MPEINSKTPLLSKPPVTRPKHKRRRSSFEASTYNSTGQAPSYVKEPLSDLESITPGLNLLQLLSLTVCMAGVQFTWTVELSYGTPYLLSLDLSKELTALVWLAGPLSGLLVQPLIGAFSDKCRSRLGKRRPFMIVSGTLTCLSMVGIAYAKEIGYWMATLSFKNNQKELESEAHTNAIIVAVFSFYFLDFTLNAVQAICRALILDIPPLWQQELANAWSARMSNTAMVIGYFVGFIDLVTYFPWIGNTQVKVFCMIAIIIFIVTLFITCVTTKEKVNEDQEGSQQPWYSTFFYIWKAFRYLPRPIQTLCNTQFFAWMGWFPFLFYSTQWVSDIYFATHPSAPEKRDWAEGTRAGSFALLCYSVISVLAGLIIPPLAVRFKKVLGILNIYTLSHLTVATALLSSWFVRSVFSATVILAIMGIPWAIVLWIPFSLVGEYVSVEDEKRQQQQQQQQPGSSMTNHEEEIPQKQEEFDAGMILGVHNMYVVFPQFAVAIISSFIFATIKDDQSMSSVTPVLIFGGLMALIAAGFKRKKALQIAAICGLSVIEEQCELVGYQIYIVEQWMCDRKIDSNVVKVFTGETSHVIQVAVIAISTAELQHPRPQVHSFISGGESNIRLKSTPLGDIVLTDPSELPFEMDMVLIPDGDYDKWVKQAYMNINLKRTNCTGRSSLNLRPPNPASEEKFRSLYKIADTVDFQEAVTNLVSIVQIALYLFKLLDKDYIDGLICNETTQALWTFYTKYDPIKTTEFTLKEPWLEPHLVAAIISKLIMCRNKLQDSNFTTIKDPFIDYDAFRFNIGDYQRAKNIRPTRFLDIETLSKLNEHTFNLKMKKVLKSKLDDISGMSNSPLFSETSDPEVFRHHATIESLRKIWRPKLRGMSTKKSRASGTAAEMLSRVAVSIPWINTATTDHKKTEIQSAVPVMNPAPSKMNQEQPQASSSHHSIPEIEHTMSPENLDQDIPSYVQFQSIQQEESRKISKEGGFVSLIGQPSIKHHKRSISDSILLSKSVLNHYHPPSFLQEQQPSLQRSNSTSSLIVLNDQQNERPSVSMNIQTYLAYQRLCQQQRALKKKLVELTSIADEYESTSAYLQQVYQKRHKMFEVIQKESHELMNDQVETEQRLKEMEDDSAKLHYELKALNDKLKDIEDNVGTFYGKVGILERKMDDSQQSITTMLLIGNYFNYYWLKIRQWISPQE
ncbi:hypothetical protein G6F46_007409 [Rhizopus delemar]|uniref:STB6-like N-terminal domain-containing protein n=2 Tax=Rhizopus TaxID=4842 RepID=A0A9P6Z0U6_9FUNG|nr:hypothetical protein G6F55_006102 [Rhizopus delemar]KAG1543191.1 hypothetical protein G6F51_006823 [Rhizopus arrhizus]KAG1495976.1 hypothetical protein G6F54_006797 [Rhizopus delemar]KAG1509821.1 hypothetical protein G6F53_007152 [Rhizopus delemar]KAG1523357.1 hypothetical protein G6F52_005088 [Rhizopus delemar]